MKRLFAIFLIFLFACLIRANAAILIGSQITIVTATTNTPSFQTNIAYINLPQISISNNNLALTNSYTGSFRFSFDGTNFINVGPVFFPATTNAGTIVVSAQTIAVPIYVQMQATTNVANTLPIQIGVTTP